MFTKPKEYHYLITIESPIANRLGTYSGVIAWNGTRMEAYQDRFRFACERAGTNVNTTFVRFWSFELNEL